MMQPLLDRISRFLMVGMVKLSAISVRLVQTMLVRLQRFWNWYSAIQWPEIPVSAIQGLIFFYVLFAVTFVIVTPIFEAADELSHFAMIETILETGNLPVQDVDMPQTAYREAGSQPPLYYGLGALIAAPFDLKEVDAYRVPNPYVTVGTPAAWGNKNLVLHDLEGTPSTTPLIMIYLLRAVNVLFGAGTVWVVYRCGALIAPQRPIAAIVAASLTAFNPMFLFLHASVTPHALAIFLNSVVIWLGLLTLRNGFSVRRSVFLAIVLALATLSKLAALLLIPVLLIAGAWMARRENTWRGFAVYGVVIVLAWVVIAGWWYARNLTLYGDPLGLTTMALIAGPRTEAFTPLTFLQEFEYFRLSYWGLFGASNIQANAVFYALADFLTLIAIGGVVFLIAQLAAIRDFSFARHELRLLLFLVAIVLPGMLGYVVWNTQTYAAEGYLLFAFIAAISPLLGAGLVEILWWIVFLLTPPERSYLRSGEVIPEPLLQSFVQWGIRTAGFVVILIPFAAISPQYVAPAPMNISAMPNDVRWVYARYDHVELIAYDAYDRRYAPGEPIRLTLYWRVQAPTERDYSLTLDLVDPYGNPLSGLSTYPGAGTLRTSQWQAGAIYADTYEIPLPRLLTARYPFYLAVNWYEDYSREAVTITDEPGNPIQQVRLNVGAIVSPAYFLNTEAIVPLDEIALIERDFQNEVRARGFAVDPGLSFVQIHWEALGRLTENYKSFVHVYNQDGELVTQDDIFPELPTRYWYFGEEFMLFYLLDAPVEGWQAGTYSVETGWYDENDALSRLVINPGEEERTTYTLFSFTVSDDGELMLPEFELPAEATESAIEGAPAPDLTPTGAMPESTEASN